MCVVGLRTVPVSAKLGELSQHIKLRKNFYSKRVIVLVREGNNSTI